MVQVELPTISQFEKIYDGWAGREVRFSYFDEIPDVQRQLQFFCQMKFLRVESIYGKLLGRNGQIANVVFAGQVAE